MYHSIPYYLCVLIIIQKLEVIFGHGLLSINESKLGAEKDNTNLLNVLCKPNHPCRYQNLSINRHQIDTEKGETSLSSENSVNENVAKFIERDKASFIGRLQEVSIKGRVLKYHNTHRESHEDDANNPNQNMTTHISNESMDSQDTREFDTLEFQVSVPGNRQEENRSALSVETDSQGFEGIPINYNDASQLENQDGDASTSFISSSNEITSKEAPDKTRGYKRLALPTKTLHIRCRL